MHKVSVVGASGAACGEVLRLLSKHPDVEIAYLMAGSSAGTYISEHHPSLHTLRTRQIEPVDITKLLTSDVVFIGLPHGASGDLTDQLDAADYQGIIIDLGADHRLTSKDAWQEFYGGEYREPYTYGLPELCGGKQREVLKNARRIAVPGCNVTAVTLALQPAVEAGWIELDDICATLAVGYSGAGKTLRADLLALNALENARPYSVGGTHRHIPEIIQNLQLINARRRGFDETANADGDDFATAKVTFTPVLVPMNRGILATVSAKFHKNHVSESVGDLFFNYYATEPFIEVLNTSEVVQTAAVSGTNIAQILPLVDKVSKRLTVICAIDNLVRGTAGQAIQSMNLALGVEETTGLCTSLN